MTWVAVAVAGTSLISGLVGSSAASSAADQQAAAAANAQGISQGEFNTITRQEQPFMASGYGSQSQLNYLLGIGTPGTMQGGKNGAPGTDASSPGGNYGSLITPFNAQNFQELSPGYNFQKQQGTQGVLNGVAAGQGALSGSAYKDLIDYNQNQANTSFNTAFNQYQTQQGNIYQRLAGISQLGQAAAANTGQQGTALAGQAAQSATNIGTAQAAGTVGSANAWTGAINSAAPWLAYGGGGTPNYSSGSYSSVMGGGGSYGAPNSYGSGYTLEDYGAQP